MKKNLTLILTTCVCFFLITSCATIISGTKQKVAITSNPPGATVYIGKFDKMSKSYLKQGTWRKIKNVETTVIGTTPLTTEIKRKTHLIFLEKAGFTDTLIYCLLPKVKIKTVNANTGDKISQKIIPAKYHSRTNGWFWGNLVLGGYVGLFVDLGTGACYRLDKIMDVTLKSK